MLALAWRLLPKRVRFGLWSRFERLQIAASTAFDRFMDRRYRVKTKLTKRFVIEDRARTIFGDQTRLAPTPYFELVRLRRRLSPRDDVFVDIGSGSGRALFVFGQKIECVGVEFDGDAIAAANANLAGYRRPRRIAFVQEDAARYRFTRETIVYLFHPFGRQTLRQVLDHIGQSLRENPRTVRICYRNPVHRDMFDDRPWLRFSFRVGETVVYEGVGPTSERRPARREAMEGAIAPPTIERPPVDPSVITLSNSAPAAQE